MSIVEHKDRKLRIIKPSAVLSDEADILQSRVYAKNLRDGMLLEAEVEDLLRERGVLKNDQSLEDKSKELRKQLRELEKELRSAQKDGRRMTLEEGRELALKIKDTRRELASADSSYQSNITTAESKARNERLNYLIYGCILDDANGQRFWKTFEDYKNEDDNELLSEATKAVLALILNKDKDYEKNLYENQWLIKQGFMDEKLRFIDSEGRLVTEDGKLINEDGYFINENGDLVDEFNNPVDKDGNLLSEDAWG